jgi:xanthine dehydrogenase molybdenum-binding subunit
MKEQFTPRVARKYLGAYRPKIDGKEKASGQTKYASDIGTKVQFPDLLYAKVLRSPYAHARIVRLDTSKARSLPGVRAVLTYDDPEIAALKPTTHGWTDATNTVTYDRIMFKFLDRRVLSNYVCWVGDEAGVVVTAESEQIAEEAIRSIDVEWEVLPFVLDPVEAMKPNAPITHADITPNNVLPSDPTNPWIGADIYLEKGNVEQGYAGADLVVESASTFQNTTQCSLDNWCCIAEWNDDKLTIWSNSYAADQTRMHVSQMLEMPMNKVRVVSPFVGGQFGRGDTGDQTFFIFTAILAKRTGRPVKFRHTRRESFQSGRMPITYVGKAGATKDGKISSLSFKSTGNVGAYHQFGLAALKFVPTEVAEVTFAHIPNLRMEAYGAYTNTIPTSVMRGIGNVQLNLNLSILIDELAEKLGMDPLQIVLKNFGCENEALPNKSLEAVLREGSARIGWKNRHKSGQGPTEGGKKRGSGFSFHPGWHTEWQETRREQIQVGMKLNPDCSVTLYAPTVETGPGSNTCNVLGCAESLSFLGVTPNDIRWESTVDTETSLKDTVQTDSAVSYLQSEAMILAAKEIKMKVLEAASTRLGANADELEVLDGRIFVKASPENGITVKELLLQVDLIPITATASRKPSPEKTGVPFMATFSEVEVDTETGQVQVLKIVIVSDGGTVMYASGFEAQQVGGQCIGVGESLTEEILYDEATGVPLNFNWIDYKIPTMVDVPDVEPVPMEVWKGAGEYGACGIGEAVLTCTPGSVVNAVYNAIGVRIGEIPITPERVLRALGKI